MKSLSLILFSFFLSDAINAQKINGIVYDRDTKKPLKNVKIEFSDIKYIKTLKVITDETGYYEINFSEFSINDSILLATVSRDNMSPQVFKISNGKAYYDFYILSYFGGCSFDSALIKYDLGDTIVPCSQKDKLIELLDLLKDNDTLNFELIYYFSYAEKDGYSISTHRANYISDFLYNHRLRKNNYRVRIREGNSSMLRIKVVY